MIIDNALISDLALGSDKNIATQGDAQTFVAPSIQPIEKLLRAHHIHTPNTGIEVQSSVVVEKVTVVVANGAATATELATLPRGLWTVSWAMEVRFDFTAVGGGHHIRFIVALEADTRHVKGYFARVGVAGANGVFRLLNVTTAVLRLDTSALGAAQNMEASLALNIERNI